MRLFVEIQRRGLLRVATGYLFVSWLVLEVGHTLFNVFELPHAGLQFVFVLLALGFPLVMLGAWQGWLTPRPRGDPHATHEEGGAHASISHEGPWLAGVFGVVALFAVAVAIGVRFFGMGHSVSHAEHDSAAAPVTSAPTSAKATNEPPSPTAASLSDKSIAVLPFNDMSEMRDQEYFADGMAEEILDLLAKLPSLKVIGRTSSFQFKGKNDDLRVIGERLGANYLVEGSVRKVGARIRVTAQLIDSHSGIHRWSEGYDRDYGDILLLQDNIATGIARSLQLAVGADDFRPQRELPSTEAYSLYLHARAALDRLGESMDVAQSELDQALGLDPSFVQAAELLAVMHTEQTLNQWIDGPTGWRQAREAAETALHIDPNSARAHAVLGMVSAAQEFLWDKADAEIGKALQANPRDPFVLDFAAHLALSRGKYAEALRHIDTALSLDPLNPYAYNTKGIIQYLASDFHEAERSLRRVNELSPSFYGARLEIAWVLMAGGELDAALKELLAETSRSAKNCGLTAVYHVMGRSRESHAALVQLMSEYKNWPSGVALAFAARGERDEAMNWLEKSYVARDPDLILWGPGHPFFASMRDDPRYQALMVKMNWPKGQSGGR